MFHRVLFLRMALRGIPSSMPESSGRDRAIGDLTNEGIREGLSSFGASLGSITAEVEPQPAQALCASFSHRGDRPRFWKHRALRRRRVRGLARDWQRG